MRILLSTISLLIFGGGLLAQVRMGPYAPPAGQNGTTAMFKDSSSFIHWAVNCEVTRGPIDITDTSKGNASAGDPVFGTEKAGVNGTVSLGDGGSATLTFGQGYIYNGPGPDLAVFENSFSNDFLELAFVEVSSNGQDFFRFPAVSLTDTSSQVGTFGSIDATDIHNLAGKYRANYGTPFDLEDLTGIPGLNVDSITHVKIVDVVGNVDPPFATYDTNGRVVNDPWPTDFSSCGFDLDAVGVTHFSGPASIKKTKGMEVSIHPNPASEYVQVSVPSRQATVELISIKGEPLFKRNIEGNSRLSLPGHIQPGVYFLRVDTKGKMNTKRLIVE